MQRKNLLPKSKASHHGGHRGHRENPRKALYWKLLVSSVTSVTSVVKSLIRGFYNISGGDRARGSARYLPRRMQRKNLSPKSKASHHGGHRGHRENPRRALYWKLLVSSVNSVTSVVKSLKIFSAASAVKRALSAIFT
jgi:hypothetical protein